MDSKKEQHFQQIEIHRMKAIQLHKVALGNHRKQLQMAKIQAINQDFKMKSIKQKYINQFKIMLQLSKMSVLQLKAHNFDYAKFKQLLIDKAEVIYRMLKFKKIDEEMLKRIQTELYCLQANVNFTFICKPYQFGIEELKKVKYDIVGHYANKMKSRIKVERQKTSQLQKKKIQLRQLVTQRRQFLKDIQKQQLNKRNKNKTIMNPPLQVINLVKQASSIQRVKNLDKIGQFQIKILSKLKHKKMCLQEEYRLMVQRVSKQQFNLQTLLRKSVHIPIGVIVPDKQTILLQKQLADLCEKYDQINKAKYKQGQRLVLEI